MKKLLLVLLISSFSIVAKSQTFLEHGLGINVSIKNDPTRWFITPEYELSILNNNRGYKQGVILGAGASIGVDNIENNYGGNLKVGYRLSNLSFGVRGGYKTEYKDKYSSEKDSGAAFGGWIGYNVNDNIKLQASVDGFSGVGIGVIFRLHKP